MTTPKCMPMVLLAAGLSLAAVLLGDEPKASPRPASQPFEAESPAVPQTQVDKFVLARLQKLGIQPAHACSDGVFVRRVYLDVIGKLPSAKEAQDFIKDTAPDKRPALIDRLLARDEFADCWAMKWCDVLRVKAEFPINLWPKGAQAYRHWIWTSLKDNKPYDRFVREMLLATGSNFYDPQVNFYRAVQSKQPEAVAKAVALTFMGARADKWPKDRLAGMAGFFSQIGYKYTGEWKEEIVFLDPSKPPAKAAFPDGKSAKLRPDQDAREAFADWLISEKNPWFAANAANRVWAWLLGRGIVQEPDDFRPDNPPQNPELLAYLQKELVSSHWDLKHIYRLILNSRTYQQSSIPLAFAKASAGDAARARENFACYGVRQLEAEVLIDAICQVTGSGEKYSSATPEPFTWVPDEVPSVVSADGSTTSSFLELFGRPPRDTGLLVERNLSPSAGQRLYMLNSSSVQRRIDQSRKLGVLFQSRGPPREMLGTLYLTVLSRYPTIDELQVAGGYFKSSGLSNRDAVVDIVWALLNSDEFLFRH